MKKFKKFYCTASFAAAIVVLVFTLCFYHVQTVSAAEADARALSEAVQGTGVNRTNEAGSTSDDINNGFSISYNNDTGNMSGAIRILLFLTILALAPSILIMLTSFTRIIIVLHFVRTAIGTQTAPPNQVLIGLALFLTLFIMSPVFSRINEEAVKPLDAGEITQEQAFQNGLQPIREFMYNEIQVKDLDMFCEIANVEYDINNLDEVSLTVLIPSFIIGELRQAFIMGFIIYIPFIIIDMVVASVLMSMGMMMLPPTTISIPFKILLFVLADGWNLVVGNVVKTFY